MDEFNTFLIQNTSQEVTDLDDTVMFNIINRTIMPNAIEDIIVKDDNDSRTIKYKIQRLFENVDLSTKSISFRYTTPDQKSDESFGRNINVSGDSFTFEWKIDGSVTHESGLVEYDIMFYDADGYKWHTKPATLKVEVGLNQTTVIPQPSTEWIDSWREEANQIVTECRNIKDNTATIITELEAYVGYSDTDIVGLEADFVNNTFTRLAGAVGKNAGADFDSYNMFGGRKRCIVNNGGKILTFYGNSDYVEDGSTGQVMVYQPKFYYKVVPLKLEPISNGKGYHIRKVRYYLSDTPKPGFKLHPAFYDENGNPVDYIFFSAYEGSMYDVSAGEYVNDGTNTDTSIGDGDLLCSVAGKKPISGYKKHLIKTNLEKMAQNRGVGWHLETIKTLSANQLLMIVEMGMMNTQTAIGQGIVSITGSSGNCSSLTGSTSELGNSTGQATSTINEIGGVETTYTENGKVSVSYRGVENPWGNNWKHINGINIWGDVSLVGCQPYIANNFVFNESKNSENYEAVGFTLSGSNGYIKAVGYGGEAFDWLLMPSEVGGTSALPVGDFVAATANPSKYYSVQSGGFWNNGINAGGFSWKYNDGAGYRSNVIGGRLIHIPQYSY